jgi:hypothetical protein
VNASTTTDVHERRFSPEAREWIRGYHGSCDRSALLLAFDAGFAKVGSLLMNVHRRVGGGVDIQTFADGTVEVRWRRLYRSGDRDELSDERFTSAPDLVAALRNVLAFEDEADRADEDEARKSAEAAR